MAFEQLRGHAEQGKSLPIAGIRLSDANPGRLASLNINRRNKER